MDNLYRDSLRKTCNPAEITRLSKLIFKEGHLELADDLIIALLPLAHIVYYKYIRYLDDREYAKEDLISEAVLRVYQDITLRWDKYIHVDAYYEYFSTIFKNGMIGLVHPYHNFYATDDLDPETIKIEDMRDSFDEVDLQILKDNIYKDIIKMSERILKCRRVNTNLLLLILKAKYVDKSGLDSLKSRVRVLGVSPDIFRFYCEHVDYVYKLSYNYNYSMIGGGKDKMISRITEVISRFEDATYKRLSVNYYDSIIPEIYAEFGPEVAKKFVRTFSGRTVQVPNYRDFCDDLVGGVIITLAKGDKSNLTKISDDYHIPYRHVARIYNRAMKVEEDLKR